MIYFWPCNRRQFVDFIANQKSLNSQEIQKCDSIEGGLVQGEDIMLVWRKSPVDTFTFPCAIIVAEGSMPDFLAWVSTYFRHLRPFTAHCRILTPSLARESSQTADLYSLPDMRSADIGLILAEGIAYSADHTDFNRLPLSAFTRTLSFAYAEGAKRYNHVHAESETVSTSIKNGWLIARKLSNQPSLNLSSSIIHDVWNVVRCAVASKGGNSAKKKSDPLLFDALLGIIEDGRVPTSVWKKLYGKSLKAEALIETLEGPREDRVKAVEMEIRGLENNSKVNGKYLAFLVGYMASRIQPGSLDHFALLIPALANLPECILWYGACSGLMPATSVDNYGNGLGRLMKREIGRPANWLDSPSCDIALSEMEILLQNRDSTNDRLRTLNSGVLNVEIYPLINANIKWSEHGDKQSSERDTQMSRQRELFNDDVPTRQDVSEILRRIEDSAMSLDAIRNKVEKTFGEKAPLKGKWKK